MVQTSQKFTINKPIDSVFNFLADGENNPKWRSGVVSIKRVFGNPSEAGAKYEQTMMGPMNKEITGDYEVIELIPREKIVFQVTAGPARPKGTFAFKELSPEQTELTFSLEWEPTGIQFLMTPMVKKTMWAELANANNIEKVIG